MAKKKVASIEVPPNKYRVFEKLIGKKLAHVHLSEGNGLWQGDGWWVFVKVNSKLGIGLLERRSKRSDSEGYYPEARTVVWLDHVVEAPPALDDDIESLFTDDLS